MGFPKCFPKGRLEVSHSLFSSVRGSLHSISSSKSDVLSLLEGKHASSMDSFACVGNPPCTINNWFSMIVMTVSNLKNDDTKECILSLSLFPKYSRSEERRVGKECRSCRWR